MAMGPSQQRNLAPSWGHWVRTPQKPNCRIWSMKWMLMVRPLERWMGTSVHSSSDVWWDRLSGPTAKQMSQDLLCGSLLATGRVNRRWRACRLPCSPARMFPGSDRYGGLFYLLWSTAQSFVTWPRSLHRVLWGSERQTATDLFKKLIVSKRRGKTP